MRHNRKRLKVIRFSEDEYLKPGYWYRPENEDSFLKMKDLGKSVVSSMSKMYSLENIQTFLEDGDIWVSNYVDGWWENTKTWNKEDYDRMTKEFYKGFREGLCELVVEIPVETTKEKKYEEYEYDYDLWDAKWGYDPDDEWSDPCYSNSYKPWIYGR